MVKNCLVLVVLFLVCFFLRLSFYYNFLWRFLCSDQMASNHVVNGWEILKAYLIKSVFLRLNFSYSPKKLILSSFCSILLIPSQSICVFVVSQLMRTSASPLCLIGMFYRYS